MRVDYELAKLQGILLESSLLSAATPEVKEYKEDWRKNPILRQGGRFASNVKTAVGDTEGGIEQSLKNTITSANKGIDQIKASIAKLEGAAQEKLRAIFQSAPMNKAKDEIGGVIEEISPEAKEAFDEVNEEIANVLDEGKDLNVALTKAQNKTMDNIKKAFASGVDAVKERKASLLAMGAIAALTATTGGAGLLIGTGAVGTVANWSVPNLLGKGKEFATTKALLEDDKDLFKVWDKEFSAEVSQFLFRASLLAAGVGILMLGEELVFDALEEDKKTFAQGVKVLTQDAIAGIGDQTGASDEDRSKLGEYFKESSGKRTGAAKDLSKQVGDRAGDFARTTTKKAVDAVNPFK